MTPLVPLLALAMAAGVADDEVELRWKWEKGREWIYKTTKKSMTDLGVGAPMVQEESNRLLLTVTDVADSGLATIAIKYLASGVKSSGPLGEFAYDSDKDKTPPQSGPTAMAARLVGLSFGVKMLPSGAVTDVEGLDKMVDDLVKSLGADADPARSQLRPMFTAATFKATLAQLFPPFSGAKVGPRDTWTHTFDVRMPIFGSMKFGQRFTLVEYKDQTALIDEEIKVSIAENESFTLKDGEGKASTVFSIPQGCYLSRKSALQMTLASSTGEVIPIKTISEIILLQK